MTCPLKQRYGELQCKRDCVENFADLLPLLISSSFISDANVHTVIIHVDISYQLCIRKLKLLFEYAVNLCSKQIL